MKIISLFENNSINGFRMKPQQQTTSMLNQALKPSVLLQSLALLLVFCLPDNRRPSIGPGTLESALTAGAGAVVQGIILLRTSRHNVVND